MRYLHTMIRVRDLPAALRFFCDGLGLVEVRRRDHEQGRYTLVFLAEPRSPASADSLHSGPGAPLTDSPQIELTHNWDQTEAYPGGRNFGHVAYQVENIYASCQRLIDHGFVVCRPPRDGRMAFTRSPDLISVELLQAGDALPPAEPWTSMKNIGEW